jgi:hypothetical protein
MSDLQIPISGQRLIHVPIHITADDFDLLLTTLQLWRHKLIHSQPRMTVLGLTTSRKPSTTPLMFNTTCRSNQIVTLNIRPVGTDGEPEPLDGLPQANLTTGAGNASVTVVDPHTIQIIPNDGYEGPVEVEITGDAAAGPEVSILKEIVHIDVFHPDAVTLGLTISVGPKVPPPQPA